MPHIKKKKEFIYIILLSIAEVGLWFLLHPETYAQRIATVSFGVFLFAFFIIVTYFWNGFVRNKPDVSK